MQNIEFQRYSMSTEVEIQIILLDRSISAIKINRFSTADKVYQVTRPSTDFSFIETTLFRVWSRKLLYLKNVNPIFISSKSLTDNSVRNSWANEFAIDCQSLI